MFLFFAIIPILVCAIIAYFILKKKAYSSDENSINKSKFIGISPILGAFIGLSLDFLIAFILLLIPISATVIPTKTDIKINQEIKIDTPMFVDAYYTLDGSNPNDGNKYEEAFYLKKSDVQNGAVTVSVQMKLFNIPIGGIETMVYEISDIDEEIKNIEANPEQHVLITTQTIISDHQEEEVHEYYGLKIEGDEIFIEENTKVLFKSDQAFFLSYNKQDNLVYANKECPSIDDAWVVYNTDGNTGFYSEKLNKYLTCEKDWAEKSLHFSSDNLQSWEYFKLHINGKFVEIQSQVNKMYLVCDINNENYPIRADQPNPQAWEQYSLYVFNEEKEIWINPLTNEELILQKQ